MKTDPVNVASEEKRAVLCIGGVHGLDLDVGEAGGLHEIQEDLGLQRALDVPHDVLAMVDELQLDSVADIATITLWRLLLHKPVNLEANQRIHRVAS